MIMTREVVLGIIFGTVYLFISKEIGVFLFALLIVWFLVKIAMSYLFANKILKKASPASICFGLKQAGHPHYQINLEKAAGLATYLPALKRRPAKSDLFWAVLIYKSLGRINNNNHLLGFV